MGNMATFAQKFLELPLLTDPITRSLLEAAATAEEKKKSLELFTAMVVYVDQIKKQATTALELVTSFFAQVDEEQKARIAIAKIISGQDDPRQAAAWKYPSDPFYGKNGPRSLWIRYVQLLCAHYALDGLIAASVNNRKSADAYFTMASGLQDYDLGGGEKAKLASMSETGSYDPKTDGPASPSTQTKKTS